MNPSPSSGTLDVKRASPYIEVPVRVPLPELPPDNLPCDDGEPLETPWHRSAMNLLIEAATYHNRDREDFFVGGNMFVYYREQQWLDESERLHFRGPDFFFVRGVPRRRPRDFYAVWREDGRYPDVIIELLSPSTEEIDRREKREVYQNIFRTPEYFLCQPQVAALEGLRLNGLAVYQPIPVNERGWLWSEQLQLWLGPWTGTYLGETSTWLRFYDALGQLVPLFAEAEKQSADQEKRRADQEKQRADQEKQRADQEKQRADTAVEEAERLRRELEELRQRLPKTQP
jgi:Uma2 family endonuclease